jgi:tryptophan synthase alpha chain
MSGRIEECFAELKSEKRAGLIPFIMGYDPDADTTLALMQAMVANGADLIEIGVPFSDPMADGPIIQAAGQRALKAGASLAGILEMVGQFRQDDAQTPVILMGYYNPIYRYGAEKFCEDAAKAGIDGLIIVDLPPEEEEELTQYLEKSSVHFIRLVAPTSLENRLPRLMKAASGFVYYISVAGITGQKSADQDVLEGQLKQLRAETDLPVAVGFGIKTVQQAKAVAGVADAVVVGSALVDVIAKADSKVDKVACAEQFISSLATALQR